MRLCCLPHAWEDVRALALATWERVQVRVTVGWRWFTGATQREWRRLKLAIANGELAL